MVPRIKNFPHYYLCYGDHKPTKKSGGQLVRYGEIVWYIIPFILSNTIYTKTLNLTDLWVEKHFQMDYIYVKGLLVIEITSSDYVVEMIFLAIWHNKHMDMLHNHIIWAFGVIK